MARIRSIKPEFWTSAQVLECSRNARLLFIGLWNFADDAGRHPDSAKQAKAEVFPADDLSIEDVEGLLRELSGNGLISRYVVDGKGYFLITGWKHQKINKPQEPKYPAPPPDHSVTAPGTLPPDTIGEDRKGKDTKGEESPPVVPPKGDPLKAIPKAMDRRRGTRLAPDWTLPDEWRGEARQLIGGASVDIDNEAALFRDYWIAKAGKEAAKVDWRATWRNWIRRTVSQAGGQPSTQDDGMSLDEIREAARQRREGPEVLQ